MSAATARQTDSDQGFLDWLVSQGYDSPKLIGNGTWVGLRALMFHWTMHRGVVGDTNGYDDRWCYADYARAKAGIEDWQARGFEGEPKFWRRHPSTGRRRNDNGDSASEWFAA